MTWTAIALNAASAAVLVLNLWLARRARRGRRQ